jgi:hypothetical protein
VSTGVPGAGTYAMDLNQVCVRLCNAKATERRGKRLRFCGFPPTATRPILRLPAHPASPWRHTRQGLAPGVCVCVYNAKAAEEGGPTG